MRILPDIPARIRVDELLLQRVRPPEANRCPRTGLSAAFRAIGAGQIQQPDPAALAAQRLQEEAAEKQRAQIAAMEQQAAALQQQQFDQGKSTLASDLRNRLNASGGTRLGSR